MAEAALSPAPQGTGATPAGALTRRRFVGLTVGAGVAAAVAPGAVAWAAAPGEVSLGRPIQGVTTAGAGYTTTADGRPLAVVIAGGTPSHLSVLDARTGELLASLELPNVLMAWGYATAPDRKLYIGTQSKGEMYRLDPDTLALTRIAALPAGQTHLWDVAFGPDGLLYVGCYPDGKVISVDPATGAVVRDYGQLAAGIQYVRSVAVGRDKVYAATATLPHVFEIDPATGTATDLALPEQYRGEQFVYDVDVVGNLLFARVTPSSTMLVYDLVGRRWVDEVPGAMGLAVSPRGLGQDAYYIGAGGVLTRYDLKSYEKTSTGVTIGNFAARGFAWLDLGLPDTPGRSLVTADSKARIYAYDPHTGKSRMVAGKAVGTPFLIRSLATGPGGDVYVGGYASPPGLARVDADTGDTELLAGVSQTEGMVAHGDLLVGGVYPGGRIFTYDTTRPWQSGTNPGPQLLLGHEQDRPVALASLADSPLVAIGSVPDYGRLGGALSLYNTANGAIEVYRGVVPDQTPVALIHRDGLVYGGTGIWGGLGIPPSTTEGHLFIFDVTTRQVVHTSVPVPGEQNVSAFAFDDAGTLWGLTANWLFAFDTATRTVVAKRKFFGVDDSAAYVTGRELFWRNGRLVGATAGRVFEVVPASPDPATWQLTTVATGASNLAIDRHGAYHYGRGSELFRYLPGT